MKKSFYLTLTGLIGMFLFLILHRIFYFWVILFSSRAASLGSWAQEPLAAEYLTLILALFCGLWYGIWIGLYWYRVVYVEKAHPGFAGHVANKIWARQLMPKGMAGRLFTATKKLETDLLKFEAEAAKKPFISAVPMKRTLVRKRAPKKLNEK
jgi:hypothetical protein